MKLLPKRLFLRDLPSNLSEKDINQKFSNYGEVTTIEIKQRKNLTVKNKFPTYAFININVDNYKLQKCFEDFQKNKWKGNYVELEIAKQNFLEKLKEERESNNKSKLHNDTEISNSSFVMEAFNKNQCYSHTTINVTNEIESPLQKRRRLMSDSEKSDNEQLISNNGKSQDIENKINSFDKTLETVSNGYVDTKVILSRLADEKRLKSINEMKKSYRKQKDAIKNALMDVDMSPNKKIVFNDNDDTEKQELQNNVIKDDLNKKYNLNSDKKALFGEDDDDELEYNFEIKEQFQGKKGKKLMELQSKFKSDKRFAMDERFLEDDNEKISADELEERMNEQPKTDYSENDNLITAEEKEKELSILEDVLGKKMVSTGKETQRKKNLKSVSMMRYDPSRPEHSKFILKENEVIREKSQKGKVNKHPNINIEIEKPIVSKEVFYEVEDNLKETLQENKSFSLLSMFGSHQHSDDEKNHDDSVHQSQIKDRENLVNIKEKNPFRYDSSDESDDEKAVQIDKAEDKVTEQNVPLGPTKLWTESFFFKADDYRLQEGIDFVRRFELDDKSEFKQVRRNIKEIVRAKVRNNQRKNKPFKKKIGGRKMVKLRKAMKNR